jgi:hypothetical protein
MIQLKIFIVSTLWTLGWALHFSATDAPVNATNLAVAFGPSIVWIVWFLLFVWDD